MRMLPQPWILVTPSSQGIGLALTRRLLKTTRLPIIATARTDIQDAREQILEGLDVMENRVEVLKMDVTGTVSFHLILRGGAPVYERAEMIYSCRPTLYRRANGGRCGRALQRSVQRLIPPRRLRDTRDTSPREITRTDRLFQSAGDVQGKHVRSIGSDETLLPLPPEESDRVSHRGRAAGQRRLRHDVRACGKYHGQQGRGLVLLPFF